MGGLADHTAFTVSEGLRNMMKIHPVLQNFPRQGCAEKAHLVQGDIQLGVPKTQLAGAALA